MKRCPSSAQREAMTQLFIAHHVPPVPEPMNPIPDELCVHIETGTAPQVGGFLFTAENKAVAMCQPCLDWCNANFASPIPLSEWQSKCPKMEAHCGFHCSVCEGMDHHWMPESDDEINEGEPFMVCKHCSATRPMSDDDADE